MNVNYYFSLSTDCQSTSEEKRNIYFLEGIMASGRVADSPTDSVDSQCSCDRWQGENYKKERGETAKLIHCGLFFPNK